MKGSDTLNVDRLTLIVAGAFALVGVVTNKQESEPQIKRIKQITQIDFEKSGVSSRIYERSERSEILFGNGLNHILSGLSRSINHLPDYQHIITSSTDY
jgi:hypothetical protein